METGRITRRRETVFSPNQTVEDTKESTSMTRERAKGHSTLPMEASMKATGRMEIRRGKGPTSGQMATCM